MKPDIENLKSTFELGLQAYEPSKKEAERMWKYFHNEYYTPEQCELLRKAGLPQETFNIVKLFTRQLTGLYSTMYNTVKLSPRHPESVQQTALLNDVIRFIDNQNHTEALNERLRLECVITGLMVHETRVVPEVDENGNIKTDPVGRVINKIEKSVIPSDEIILDPMSREIDYSDARFIHRYRWLTEEELREMFSGHKVSKLDELETMISTHTVEDKVDVVTPYKRHNNYLVVHTYIKHKGDIWSVWWSNKTILAKHKVKGTYNTFPIQVVKLQETTEPEYYGVFRDVEGSILAIHQALIQIQMHVNSNKVVVRKGAVADEDWEDFKTAVVRVNSILELDEPEDIRIMNMDRDIAQQYLIVDRAFDRIQRVLGVNDSFLGQAYASDSGRKVKLQQNQTLMALRYLDERFLLMFNLIGRDVVRLVKQFFTAYQVMRIATPQDEDKWIEINKPLIEPMSGQVLMEPQLDPYTGEPVRDKYGNILMAVFNDHDTDISVSEEDFEVVSTMYNDDDEKNQLLLETMLSGNIGLALQQYNPAGFLRASALSVQSMKSRHSKDIATILNQTADLMMPQQPNTPPQGVQQMGGQSANSQQLKLPQNTNEGV